MEVTGMGKVGDIHEALESVQTMLPGPVSFAAFRVEWDGHLQRDIATIAMVCDYPWSPDLEKIWTEAMSLSWRALAPLNALPDIFCRTPDEHDEARTTEDWIELPERVALS